MKKFILALALAVVAPLVAPQLTNNIVHAQEKPILIDVRTQEEFDEDHIEGALLVPYDQISQKIASIAHDKRQLVNLYCRSGRRAEIALHTLEKLGYTSVQNLGGIADLRKRGMK